MRTAIMFGSMMISDSILALARSNGYVPPETPYSVISFVGWTIIAMAAFDIFEVFKK